MQETLVLQETEVGANSPGLEQLSAGGREAWGAMAGHPTTLAGFVETAQSHPPRGVEAGVVAGREGGRLISGAPAFLWTLMLESVVGAGPKPFVRLLDRVAPQYVRVPILCIGSPLVDRCRILVDPKLEGAARHDALVAIVAASATCAHRTGAHMIVFKDVSQVLAGEMHDALASAGFSRLPSLPAAVLDLPFATLDEYLGSFDGRLRSELRRKIRQSAAVSIEVVSDIDGVAADVERLLSETRLRRSFDFGDFDELPPGFAHTLLRRMAPFGRCAITRIDGAVVGCNLFFVKDGVATAFLIGLSNQHVREHNLYFVNWLWMVRYAIERGLERIEFGQSSYGLKRRLGCRLEPSWIYVRHCRRGWNRVVKMVAPRLSLPRLDPELEGWEPLGA